MDSATLQMLRDQITLAEHQRTITGILAEAADVLARLAAASEAMEKAVANTDIRTERRCFDCHRPARAMTKCSDGEWRGPACAPRYEATAGTQLPIQEGAR